MIVFHGTNSAYANTIVGPPSDVQLRGGGELGKGFYLGESIALANSWAKGRFNDDSAVIEFNINNSEYIKLNTKVIRGQKEVKQLWKSLCKNSERNSYLFNFDVVCAPFATIDFSYQYKFESEDAQVLLNNSNKQIL